MKKIAENHFDVVVIGSSPISMLEAIYWVSNKKKVAILEKSALGGSWKYISALGFEKLEIGPHVFFGERSGYKILKKLGLAYRRRSIWNFDIHSRHLYKKYYSLQMFYEEMVSRFKKRIFRQKLEIKKFHLLKIFMDYIKNKVAYLERGCPQLLLAIFQLEKWKDVNVVYAECQNIIFDKNKQLNLMTSVGKVSCDQVIITSCCDIDFREAYKTYSNSCEEVSFEMQPFGSVQVSLLLKNNYRNLRFTKFQYESTDILGTSNVVKKKKFKYIINLTDCVEKSNNVNLRCSNLSVISLAVDSEYYNLLSGEPDMSALIKDLKKFRLISRESELLRFHNEVVKGQSFTKQGALEINRLFNGKITCLISESLIQAFSENSKRWLKIFKN